MQLVSIVITLAIMIYYARKVNLTKITEPNVEYGLSLERSAKNLSYTVSGNKGFMLGGMGFYLLLVYMYLSIMVIVIEHPLYWLFAGVIFCIQITDVMVSYFCVILNKSMFRQKWYVILNKISVFLTYQFLFITLALLIV